MHPILCVLLLPSGEGSFGEPWSAAESHALADLFGLSRIVPSLQHFWNLTGRVLEDYFFLWGGQRCLFLLALRAG